MLIFLFRNGFNTARALGEKLQPYVTTFVKAIAHRIYGRELEGEPSEEANTVHLSLALALRHDERPQHKGQGMYIRYIMETMTDWCC